MQLLLASTSTVYGGSYLEYILPEAARFFQDAGEVVFIPYARPGGITWREYSDKACRAFASAGITMRGIESYADPEQAIEAAGGVFTGGGNTFVLLNQLYNSGLVKPLKERVRAGMPYMGSSAGSNIAGKTIGTTNDMPIIQPPSFDALQLLPFNLNPHYIDPMPESKHMGETRETRIQEFHRYNEQLVVGLREGSWLRMDNARLSLEGTLQARIFRKDQAPEEVDAGSDLTGLLSRQS